MSGWELVEALGLVVIAVPNLRDKVVHVPTHGVVLIRPDLDDEDRELGVDRLIQIAAAS
ncbi:hypothetical protein [Georgenia muralis]